ncbi:hypothetical protein [Phyllobacterium myrsinacearum]|uniref:DUF1795 domain-containing protein n=1 Tax=Phyllobacterium myrsinacearum TaxID=28101 RepID=A0A839EIG7_9HYPH|nr:hypothetical protein [Phyllobacterium myrsinacearum]MBA8878682.1 hypothetical protein [Phyllobacterium myrsinacearum]
MRYITALLVFMVISLVNVQTGFAQEAVFPEGSSVGLIIPKNMQASSTFSGFEDVKTGASIVFTELPADAYAQIVPKFNAEGLAPTGIVVTDAVQDWTVKGASAAKYIHGSQIASGVKYSKWIVLTQAPKTTAMVTMQVPDGIAGGPSDADIEATLRSIAVRSPPTLEEQVTALPFKVGDLAEFRPIRVIAGATYILTDGPQDIPANSSQPVIIIASNLGNAPEADQRMDFAKQAFASLTGIKDVRSDNETSAQADGGEWVEIDGSAKDTASGDTLYVAQIARFETNRYVRAILIVRSSEKDKYAERFRRLAKSLTIN